MKIDWKSKKIRIGVPIAVIGFALIAAIVDTNFGGKRISSSHEDVAQLKIELRRFPVGSPESALVKDFEARGFQKRQRWFSPRGACKDVRNLGLPIGSGFVDVGHRFTNQRSSIYYIVSWCADKDGNITWIHDDFGTWDIQDSILWQ